MIKFQEFSVFKELFWYTYFHVWQMFESWARINKSIISKNVWIQLIWHNWLCLSGHQWTSSLESIVHYTILRALFGPCPQPHHFDFVVLIDFVNIFFVDDKCGNSNFWTWYSSNGGHNTKRSLSTLYLEEKRNHKIILEMSIIFDFCIVVLLLGIIGLLLVQAFSYAIPSLILGLIGAQIASIWLIGRLRDLTGIPIDPYTHTHTHIHQEILLADCCCCYWYNCCLEF